MLIMPLLLDKTEERQRAGKQKLCGQAGTLTSLAQIQNKKSVA